MPKHVYRLDGREFSTLEEFFDVVSRVLVPGAPWGRNLNAFNDILRGGFGTPDEGFVLQWQHSDISRRRLGGREGEAESDFDVLIKIIRTHGPGGEEAHDGVELILD